MALIFPPLFFWEEGERSSQLRIVTKLPHEVSILQFAPSPFENCGNAPGKSLPGGTEYINFIPTKVIQIPGKMKNHHQYNGDTAQGVYFPQSS